MSIEFHKPRTPWQVTWSVWRALFIREALQRTMADRFAWFWMFAEPIAQIVLFVAIRELLGRVRIITGAEFIPWLIVGMMTFFMFREGLTRSLGAIDANRALFSYRQVKPIDAVLVRCAVEGILRSLIFLILIVGASTIGISVIPDNALGAIHIWLLAWFLGVGAGLFFSVANSLVNEVGIIVRVVLFPLYFLSGVIIPMTILPHDIQAYVLYNPLFHLVELMRADFFETYRPINGVSHLYIIWWALVMAVVGLAMHSRFESRVKAE